MNKGIGSTVKEEFISRRMLYIILKVHWHDITALNVHAPTWDKHDDKKQSFCEEVECVFDQFFKYQIRVLLDFNVKIEREDIFKPTIRNESFALN